MNETFHKNFKKSVERWAKEEREARRAQPIEEREANVLAVVYEVHAKQHKTYTNGRYVNTGTVDSYSVKARYELDNGETIDAYYCPEHDGFAREKCEKWYAAQTNGASLPDADDYNPGELCAKVVEEAKAGTIATPSRVRLWKRSADRFWNVETLN